MLRRPFARYVAVLAAVGILGGAGAVMMRLNTFGCRGAGLTEGVFIASCETRRYGDFEHGAYLFTLRPNAVAALKSATVLFLGNSRLQAALSGENVQAHFVSRGIRHYLLGFGHAEESGFADVLARRHGLRPTAVIVNADPFFTGSMSAVAREMVLSPASSERNYRLKAIWQEAHRIACVRSGLGSTATCNRNPTVYRRDDDGHWMFAGFDFTRRTPTEPYRDRTVDARDFATYLTQARALASRLGVQPHCIILTEVPTSEPPRGVAHTLAQALGARVAIPDVTGLETFDRSHLTPDSAVRWANAFMSIAGPVIDACGKP